MNNYYTRILVLLLLIMAVGKEIIAQQDIEISEIVPLNTAILTDEDGEYSDIIEIHNAGTSPILLEGWSLTDDPEIPGKWRFPAFYIIPDQYIFIFSSGKDRNAAASELHTNFKLDAEGEYLALYDPQGNPATVFDPFPAVKENESYGILDSTYAMFAVPSPGSVNLEANATLYPAEISHSRGLYYEPFALSLSSDIADARIYYTTDGSTPAMYTASRYRNPLTIDSTTIFRAIVTYGDRIPSEVITHTYIFPEQVVYQDSTPTGFPDQWGYWTYSSGRAYADYEMDPEMLSDPAFAAQLLEALESLPSISLVTELDNFFSISSDSETGGIYMYPAPGENDTGRGWERPVSFEYFSADSSESLQVNCGIQINGGESRRPEKNPKHSFRLRFRGEYGPAKLNYDLFGDPSVSTFDVLILRGGFNNSWTHWDVAERNRGQYIQDIWAKDTYRAMNHVAGNSSFAHLYINGVYWGIYAPSERMDSEFAASYFEGEPEDFDVIKDYVEVADGNIEAWNELIASANSGFSTDEAYFAIQGKKTDGSNDPNGRALVDIRSIADYMLLNLYAGNTDWDHHNWAATKNRNNPSQGFEFLVWDTEHIMERLNHNMVGEYNTGCPSHIFQSLRQNERFRLYFADRVQRFCFEGGLLSPSGVRATWDKRLAEIVKAIPAESARWGDYRRDVHPYQYGPYELYTYDNHFLIEQDFLYNEYFPQRTSVLINQLRGEGLYPQLDAPAFHLDGELLVSNIVEYGQELSMLTNEGDIYYTLDGSDPAVWKDDEAESFVFLEAGADKKVLVPTSDIGNEWKSSPDYDDSSWLNCSGDPGGVGYEKESGYEGMITLDVGELMHDDGGSPNESCYIRIGFNVEASQLENLGSLLLYMQYDDGFEAYLNGSLVASVNAPANCIWNSGATGYNEASSSASVFDISSFISSLNEGNNLLAIQGLNNGTSSSDFIIRASLSGSEEKLFELSDGAILYSGIMPLDSSIHIKARTVSTGTWSAMNEKYLMIPEDFRGIKITEVQYNPQPVDTTDDDNFEFIELKNTGSGTLNIGGMTFAKGIDYTFAPETRMDPGDFIVLASEPEYFAARYGFAPFDEYKGRLDNNGERVALLDPFGDTLYSFRYEDDLPWPQYADGSGLSMVPVDINPLGDLKTPDQWRESYYRGGSPGEDDIDTSTHVIGVVDYSPAYVIGEIYPNPFSGRAFLEYRLEEQTQVEISIYSISGSLLRVLESSEQGAGEYRVSWDGSVSDGSMAGPGVYFCNVVFRNSRGVWKETKKVVVL